MKCKECEKEGKKSIVHIGVCSTTYQLPSHFYDEEGRHHVHNQEIKTIDHSCSNGHFFQISISGKCPGHYAGYCDLEKEDR